MTSLDFLKALLILGCLISLINRELNIQTPCGILLSIIIAKTPFLSSPLISLYYESIKGVFYTRTNIFIDRSYFIGTSIEVR
jgi:surface polysaccharide O-acyltransferase-like enzyme